MSDRPLPPLASARAKNTAPPLADVPFWVSALVAAALAVWLPPGAGRLVCVGLAAAAGSIGAYRAWCRRAIARAILAERREVELAGHDARQHAASWRAIVDTATEGIITIDVRGSILTVNDAAKRMFGFALEELIGHNVRVLMPEPFHSEHDGYLQRYLATDEPHIIGIGREVVGQRKDGSTFPVDLSVGEGSTDDGRFFTAVVRDITVRKELQSKLAQAERLAAVGELAAGVAHEINNPANTIINCAQLIEDGDEVLPNARIVIEEGARISDIVKALLTFARDDEDLPQPTSLHEVVERTQRLIAENWKRHGVELRIELPDDLPAVLARPQKLQQVLLNLLINAKDALLGSDSTDRDVVIDASVVDGGVEFRVADRGPGVAEALRGRVFEPFVTTKRARGGTGLGLSISRGIVEGYRGRISLDAEHRPGACFNVWLPVAPHD